MDIKNATLNDNKLIIEVDTLKLKSKQYKHGYYNNKDGIWLYDQNHVRKQLACFHLSKITVNKETTENNWINQWKQDVTLTFNTTENDEINLAMDGDYSPNFNIAQFCENFDYLFSTCYKTQPPIKNFHEYIIILLHEFYHEFNRELYSLYNNIPLYTLNAEGTVCQKAIKGTITIFDSKNQAVTDGTLTVTCGEHTAIKDIATEYETTNNTSYDWSIQSQEDENILLTYTNKHGLTVSIELDKNGLPILPTSEILINDVTMQYGDNVNLSVEILSSDDSIINEGTVTLDYKQGTNVNKRVRNIPVINGVIDVDIPALKPATYTIQAIYKSNGNYEDSTATATLTINKGDVHFQVDTNNLFVTVHGAVAVNAVLLDQNNNPVTSHKPDCGVKYGGKTTLFNLEEDGHVPEYIKTNVFLNRSYDYEVLFVAGLNNYWNEVRNSYDVTTETEPVWDLFARQINGNPGLELMTIGFPPEQVVTAYIDDVNVGEFIIQDSTDARDGEGTATIELSNEYAGNQVVTLKTTFIWDIGQQGYTREYTKEFNLTL